LALRRGIAVLQRHGDASAIAGPTIRDCAVGLVRATAEQELAIECTDGSVQVDGVVLFAIGTGEAPFGLLAAAGIGTLCVPQGLREAEAERLVRALAALDAEAPWLALDAAGIPALHWRAAGIGGDAAAAVPNHDLPPPSPSAQHWAPVVARAQLANLPFAAVRLVLEALAQAELDLPAPTAATLAALHRALPDLTHRMLQNGDAPGLAWVLEQGLASRGVPPELARDLHAAIAARCTTAWFAAQTAAGQPVADLAALAMQLGAAALRDFAAAAAASGAPLPAGLAELLSLPER
jgi:hypothetical protein